MKKIIFVTPHMILGGLEKSLISLVEMLPKDMYEITIMVVKKQGELLEEIPEGINLIEVPIDENIKDELLMGGVKALVIKYLKEFKFINAFYLLVKKTFHLNPVPELKISFDSIPTYKKEFDIAVAYQMHMPFIVKYVSEKIISKKKIVWMHSDFKSSRFNPNTIKKELYSYSNYIAVSKQSRDEFISFFPEFETKTKIAYNILQKDQILELSKETIEFDADYNGLKILTIGRLAKEKGIDLAVEVCKLLKLEQYNFKWYVIGDGPQREEIIKKIKFHNLENYFELLGAKKNPYPYLKECDLYVQPSRSEGYCITLSEAKIFAKPIVTTNFAGAIEQINNNKNGLVTDVEKKDIYFAIKKLLDSKKLRQEFSYDLLLNNINEAENRLNAVIEIFNNSDNEENHEKRPLARTKN